MNKLVYLLLITIYSVDYLASNYAFIPRLVTWVPELISGVILIAVIGRLVSPSTTILPAKYVAWASYMLLLIVAGIILNDVQPGAIFAGLRKYFRYAPVFLLPIVFPFSEAQLRGQLLLMLVLVLCQLPMAVYQRLFIYPLTPTGDIVQGTVMGSGALTIILVAVISILTAFYVKGRLKLSTYLVLTAACFIPTTINETTATLLLLPIAIGTPFMLSAGAGTRLARLLPLGIVGALLITVFTITYNAQFDRWGGDVTGVLTGRGVEFVYKGAGETSRADEGKGMSEIGRFDSIVMPFYKLKDRTKLMLGVGIGNASASFNDLLAGEYTDLVDTYGIDFTTATSLIWETGLIGLCLSFVLLFLVFRDAFALRRRDDLTGAFAMGVASMVVVLSAAIFYTGIVAHNVIGFSMWLMFGHVAGMRARSMVPTDDVAPPSYFAVDPHSLDLDQPSPSQPPPGRRTMGRPSLGPRTLASRTLGRPPLGERGR